MRLTDEESALLERFRTERDLSTRSDAVRALVRGAGSAPASSAELPATLKAELEEVVEEGYALDLDGAVATALTLGLAELARIHADRLPALRERAREVAERRRSRTRADREGRGLLGQ